MMTCPRSCDVDIRLHHSSTSINGKCDTGPMSLDEMSAWFEIRGAGPNLAQLISEHYGKTENELDEIYETMHGSMA